MLLIGVMAGCGGTPFGWKTCSLGVPCQDTEFTCSYVRRVDNTTCVTELDQRCVKRCTSNADCAGQRSEKGPTETCVTDCAGDRYCDGTR